MLDIFLDAVIDTLKLIPFLFIAFLIIEFTEHKLNNKKIVSKSRRLGPIIGSLLGIFPQCGFSVLATNLYITRIISLGTLIAVYLSTSDEMLPIMIAQRADIKDILCLLLIKFIVGIVFGFIIDLLITKRDKVNYEICKHDHCDCNHSFINSAIKHTFKTSLFIFAFTLFINFIFSYGGEGYLKHIFSKNNWFTPFISGLIGLIPNCGSSILITELYLNNLLPLGPTISGLLTGSGVALLVLFKSNPNLKENIKIITILYGIGVFVGILFEIFKIV